MKLDTRMARTQRGTFHAASTRNPEYGRKVRSFRKEDEEGAEVFYRPGKFAVVKGKEMREFSYSTTERGSRASAKQKAFKCAGDWCGMAKHAEHDQQSHAGDDGGETPTRDAVRSLSRIADKASKNATTTASHVHAARAHFRARDARESQLDYSGRDALHGAGEDAVAKFKEHEKRALAHSDAAAAMRKSETLMKPDSVEDHDLWEKAKKASKDPENYALVNSIYQKMGGKFMSKATDDLGLSFREIEDAVRGAVNSKWGVRAYIEQIYPDSQVAIIHIYPDMPMYGGPYAMSDSTKKHCVRVSYEVDDKGVVNLGETEDVKQVWVKMDKALEDLCKNVEEYGADDATFSARVRASLKANELTELDLAQRTGIPEEDLTQMLSGKLVWDRAAKLRVADAANLQTSEWLTKAMSGDDYANHARRMRRQMEKQGLTVADLADECDLDEEIVQKAIQGGKVSSEDMDSLHDALGMGKATAPAAAGTSTVFKGYRTEGGSFLFELAKEDRAPLIKALEDAGEECSENEEGVELRKDVEGNEIEVRCEKADEPKPAPKAERVGKSLSFPGIRLPHTNSFFFEANGSSQALAKALQDTGACKTVKSDLFGVTVEFEKSAKGEDCEIVCEKGAPFGNTNAKGSRGGSEGTPKRTIGYSGAEDPKSGGGGGGGDKDKSYTGPKMNRELMERHSNRHLSLARRVLKEDYVPSPERNARHTDAVIAVREYNKVIAVGVDVGDVEQREGEAIVAVQKFEQSLKMKKSSEISLLKADTAELSKAKERGIVYGVAYEPNRTDLQNEYASEDDVRKAAEDFMTNPQVRVQHGKMSKSKVVFSYVTEKGDRVLGKEWTPGTWIVGVKLSPEDKVLYKTGKITGYSMGGTKRFA